MANVSTAGARVNGNPPEADYGSNREACCRLPAPSFWLQAQAPVLRGFAGYFTDGGGLRDGPNPALGAAYGLFVPCDWHEGGMYIFSGGPYLFLEQTWGRAVRASHNSREFGALLIWGVFSPFFWTDGRSFLWPDLRNQTCRCGRGRCGRGRLARVGFGRARNSPHRG